MENQNLQKQIDELKKEVEALKTRRITQEMILPNVIKTRMVGEGVRFIRSGLAADRPTEGEGTASGSAMYFATDSGLLSIWDGSSWLETTLT